MGVFDYIRCEYPLPAPDAGHLEYQTKDTDEQYLGQYVIRADGSLWHEEYDTEDRSDPAAEGLAALLGSATRVNKRWVRVLDETGEIRFYSLCGPEMWLEFSAYFRAGVLQQINLIADTRVLEQGRQHAK